MLEAPDSDNDPIPVKNAKMSYAACMDTGEFYFIFYGKNVIEIIIKLTLVH